MRDEQGHYRVPGHHGKDLLEEELNQHSEWCGLCMFDCLQRTLQVIRITHFVYVMLMPNYTTLRSMPAAASDPWQKELLLARSTAGV